jgi:hypothetical protein
MIRQPPESFINRTPNMPPALCVPELVLGAGFVKRWPVGAFHCRHDLQSAYSSPMSTVEETDVVIHLMSLDLMTACRDWHAGFDAALARQIAEDKVARRLDWLLIETLGNREAGRCADR